MVFSALQLDQSHSELPAEHVDLSRLAEFLLSDLPTVQLSGPIQVLLLLEDFQGAVDAQLQTVVHTTTENLFFLGLKERKSRPCKDVDYSLLKENMLLGLEDLEGLIIPCEA